MAAAGTARVEVRAISFDEAPPARSAVKVAEGTFLQVGAFGEREAAEQLAGKMMAEHLQPVSVQQGGGLYKVWVGPYRDARDIELTTARLIELGYERPHKVKP